jgi:hypothetical protein
MPANVTKLASAVVGHRIVAAAKEDAPATGYGHGDSLLLTLDDGRVVRMQGIYDCCAYAEVEEFFLDPSAVDHVILGVGTTEQYQTWHIYADFGDIMRLKVGWSCGNPLYYAYGFDINIEEVDAIAHRAA